MKSLIATDLAEHEGIALNPVYTGKAMAGLPALNEQKYFEPGTNIVFVHTGGTPALFPYRDGILRRLDLKGKGELKNVLDPPLSKFLLYFVCRCPVVCHLPNPRIGTRVACRKDSFAHLFDELVDRDKP